jgi:Ala-tRNA(Pro) deacylase
MIATRNDLFVFLDKLNILHSTVEHAPAHTVEQAQANRGLLPGGHAKNLFLKCKKGNLFLLVAQEDTPIRLNHLHKRIGSGRLSFASQELMMDVLGITPGSVTPFALLNDREQSVTVILDKPLMEKDPLNFHPLENTATTTISRDDLLLFLKECGFHPQIIDLGLDDIQ